MPGETLPTSLCAITPPTNTLHRGATAGDPAALLAMRLRQGNGQTPVVGRVLRDQVLLDPRTVLPEQDSALLQAVRAAFVAV